MRASARLGRVRRRAGGLMMKGLFEGLARAGGKHPAAEPGRHGVERIRDLPYRPGGGAEHQLDVYRPAERRGLAPCVLYLHGGAFHMLSKDTHWVMGLGFARRGYVVFNANYRLAPAHRFPSGLEDASAALEWVWKHAAEYGADRERLILAGESAGANLATALALACAYARPEPYARRLFDLGVRCAALLPACGVLQVSDQARFARRRPLSRFIRDRLEEVERIYLGDGAGAELADPVCVLEQGTPPARPLPPTFALVGTRDPLLDDTRRLGVALTRLGVVNEIRYYPGGVHAFHAFVFDPRARRAWRDQLRFLDAQGLAASPAP